MSHETSARNHAKLETVKTNYISFYIILKGEWGIFTHICLGFGFVFFLNSECVLIYISSWEEGCEKFRCRGQRGEKGGS